SHRHFGYSPTTADACLDRDFDLLVLSIKPQVMQALCAALPTPRRSGQLVISIAAGTTCASLAAWLGADTPLIRCMPNTPALRGQGVSGLFAVPRVSAEQRKLAESILNAVGISLWLEQE